MYDDMGLIPWQGNGCGSHRFQETGTLSIELKQRLLQRHLDASNYEARFFERLDWPKAVEERSHFTDITEATVILAIAAVWRGLDESGIRFSFGDAALFRGARTTRNPQVTAVSPSDSLIMPLFFRQGEAGNNRDHHVLAVAERMDQAGAIRLIFMCSHLRERSEKKEVVRYPVLQQTIREAAQNIVRNSGWMPNNMQPIFHRSNQVWRMVPDAVATTGVAALKDTSAYQVVLNAWAYMLDIQINIRHVRNVRQLSDPLYVGTLKLINMALDGRIDSQTIRCFLLEMEYGLNTVGRRLSRIRDVDEMRDQRRVLDGTRAFLMNNEIFDRLIKAFRTNPNQAPAQGISRASSSERPIVGVGPAEGTGGGSEKPVDIQGPTEEHLKVVMNLLMSIRPPSPKGPQPGPMTKTDWMAKFQSNHGRFMAQMRKVRHFPLKIGKDTELSDEQIFSAIGAIWHPLWKKGVRFSFAVPSTCTLNRKLEKLEVGNRAIAGSGGEYPLILPLLGHGNKFLTGEDVQKEEERKEKEGAENNKGKQPGKAEKETNTQKTKNHTKGGPPNDKKKTEKDKDPTKWVEPGGLGHYVLVVADRIPTTDMTVRIQLLDSFPTVTDKGAIWDVANSLVRQIGWLDYDVANNRAVVVNPQNTLQCQRKALHQSCGNTCGLHVILNAWAFMLNIELARDRRRGSVSASVFYRVGHQVVNCVMAGCYDTETIQAFMIAYGFAADPENAGSNQPLVQVNAVWMNDLILANVIQEILDDERQERELNNQIASGLFD